jgi:hypothetical protein
MLKPFLEQVIGEVMEESILRQKIQPVGCPVGIGGWCSDSRQFFEILIARLTFL